MASAFVIHFTFDSRASNASYRSFLSSSTSLAHGASSSILKSDLRQFTQLSCQTIPTSSTSRTSASSPLTMAPDPSLTMAEQTDQVTSFFSLPRELRDRIYDMAREDHRKMFDEVVFDFRAAIPEERLVSHQFKAEYDERSTVNTFVRVFDPSNKCTFEHFPRLAINSRYLELA